VAQSSRLGAILVWGVDPEYHFKFPEVDQNLDHLKLLNQILFDRQVVALSDRWGVQKTGTVETELNDKAVSVKLTYKWCFLCPPMAM